MDNEMPKRKPIRLKEYDYSQPGAYFLTICTQNRKCFLSRVVSGCDPSRLDIVGEGLPLPKLSVCGEIVEKWILHISDRYPQISVESYVIMPNHIHLMLLVREDNGRGDPAPTEDVRVKESLVQPSGVNSPRIDAVMGWFKYHATKEINKICGNMVGKVFQRAFHDHIIRNRQDYDEHMRYIYENPLCWMYDELYCEDEL